MEAMCLMSGGELRSVCSSIEKLIAVEHWKSVPKGYCVILSQGCNLTPASSSTRFAALSTM